MLDFFLVLGQVPGTEYRLEFWQLICGYSAILLLMWGARKYRGSRQTIAKARVIQLSSLAKQNTITLKHP